MVMAGALIAAMPTLLIYTLWDVTSSAASSPVR